MEKLKRALDIKYDLLSKELQKDYSFTVSDAQSVWQAKTSSTYWNLSKLVEAGRLKRLQNGVYTISEEWRHSIIPSTLARHTHAILSESGFSFYISGLDILMQYMQNLPDQYPVILFADKNAIDEIRDLLVGAGIIVMSGKASQESKRFMDNNRMKDVVFLYPTRSFTFEKDGYAVLEKAFVDLYMEITRKAYPLSIQELARIYIEMAQQKGLINRARLMQAARLRSIQSEMLLLANLDHIHSSAIKLAAIIKGDS